MQCANSVVFSHHRKESMMDGEEYVITSEQSLGMLPELFLYQIAIDKQAIKEYIPYGNQKSYYLPTGMNGPTIKLSCRVLDVSPWNNVYTNDYLRVVTFPFDTWATVLSIGSDWWVDSISGDAKLGFKVGTKMRRELNIDLYKRTVA